ncbi:MYCBP associated protein [Cricetulus griseus]
MKALKKESRLKIPTSKFLEAADSIKEKKRAKAPEQPTPPIQEEPEPVSNVLQGDDILALAIKKDDLKKQHIPRFTETGEKPVETQKFIIRKLKPKDSSRKVYHLVAHPAHPDATTKPLDYSGPSDSFLSSDQILPHQILGSLQDFKRIAVARGNTQLAKLIHIQPCLMTLISAKEESKPKSPKEVKRPPWAPPLQHNFLKNWRRHVALWKKQQEVLSEHLKKPVSELLMHTGESYRKIQEERQLIDRALPTQHDGKGFKAANWFWSPLEYLGDEMTGLLMTKTKTQRGLVEPITHIRKPHSIQVETGLPTQNDAWYRHTWDRSLFLIYRRKELQSIMAELDFSQEVANAFIPYPKKNIGIGVRLTFETLEGDKTSSELTVANNGTVAIWYDWRRRPQMDFFQDLKRNRTQRFYFNNREGVILPGESKHFTFFFKSLNAGIFRESWEFGTHPTLLGGAVLQVTLHAISLTQDVFMDERKLLESKLDAHEAVVIAQSLLQEVLRGVSTPERAPSPVDAYLTEEDLFHYRNPRLHYQHQVVQSLHQLWHQYSILPLMTEEARAGQEDTLTSRARLAPVPLVFVEKALGSSGHLMGSRGQVTEASPLQLRQEMDMLKEARDLFPHQKIGTGIGTKSFPRKSIMEEILVEESPDTKTTRSPRKLGSRPLPKWNLCLEDFRKAVMTFPEETQREDALIQLNKAAVDLCQEQKPLQSDLLHQTCLQLWRDVIDSLVSQSLWLRALLGLPEKETVYLDVPDDQGHKSPPVTDMKVPVGRVGKEDRKGGTQEKKVLGIRDKEDKKGVKIPGKEDRLNSKKQKSKDDKKVVKSASRDRLSSEDPTHDGTAHSHEPIDPLVMEKYIHRLHAEVYGLLDTLVTDMMILADELRPLESAEEPLRFCI